MPKSCWRNFLTRTGLVQHWTDLCGRLTLQGLQTGSPAAAENVRSAQETCKCLCKWRPLWAQIVTDGIAYELLRRLFHIGNFCFWVPLFKQLLLKNCAVDFAEICNVCTRKVIIKAANRIFNSDKICRSYCYFYLAEFRKTNWFLLLWTSSCYTRLVRKYACGLGRRLHTHSHRSTTRIVHTSPFIGFNFLSLL